MDQAEIRRGIASFDRWHYRFDLDGNETPIFNPRAVNRHEQRSAYFFDALLRVTGGSLKGKRVLDLGCNAGFWSLRAIDAGCDFVYGVDGRQMHIDQANFVFAVKDVDPARYEFNVASVYTDDLAARGPFDVALCLGLLYHVGKPVELFERISNVNTDLLVVDTLISAGPSSTLDVHWEPTDDPVNAVDHELIVHPTRQAVLDLGRSFGYQGLPLKLNFSDFAGMEGYQRGERLAFVFSKQTSLAGLAADTSSPPLARLEQLVTSGFRVARRGLFVAKHSLRT